jgi:hypothetical protein
VKLIRKKLTTKHNVISAKEEHKLKEHKNQKQSTSKNLEQCLNKTHEEGRKR